VRRPGLARFGHQCQQLASAWRLLRKHDFAQRSRTGAHNETACHVSAALAFLAAEQGLRSADCYGHGRLGGECWWPMTHQSREAAPMTHQSREAALTTNLVSGCFVDVVDVNRAILLVREIDEKIGVVLKHCQIRLDNFLRPRLSYVYPDSCA
jgi:hypothetical protein